MTDKELPVQPEPRRRMERIVIMIGGDSYAVDEQVNDQGTSVVLKKQVGGRWYYVFDSEVRDDDIKQAVMDCFLWALNQLPEGIFGF